MPRNREEVRDLEDAPERTAPGARGIRSGGSGCSQAALTPAAPGCAVGGDREAVRWVGEEDALQEGLAGLDRAASELGAGTLAVLVLEAASLEIAYRRPSAAGVPPQICHQREMHQALAAESGPVRADSAVARFLTSFVAPAAKSFLLFPWRARSRVVTIIFGFAESEPAHASVPAHLMESLSLAALAAWSVKEVTRLRAELRVVNGQFAARKLVERAKAALQAERGMNEQEAYEYLRKMSRQRRITLSKLAEDLLGAGRWP